MEKAAKRRLFRFQKLIINIKVVTIYRMTGDKRKKGGNNSIMQNDSKGCEPNSFARRLVKNMFSFTLLSVIPFSPIVMVAESPVIDKGEKQEIVEFVELEIFHELAEESTSTIQQAEMPELRFNPTEEELELLARTVYSEARGEDFKGQIAVAAVVLNRLESKEFPDDIYEIIFQPNAFTAIRDGQFWLEPDESSFLAVEEALKGEDPSGGALYYYNPSGATSQWIFSRTVIKSIGNHKFAI